MNNEYVHTGETRVFVIENRAGPANVPDYQGCWKASGVTSPRGEPTIVTCPDPTQYGKFKTVGKIPGEKGLPGVTIMARLKQDASDLLKIFKRYCDVDMQVHIGECGDPQDFNEGWEKILNFEAALPGGDYSISDLGAMEQGDQAPVNEELDFKAEEYYEILPIAFEEMAESEAVQEIIKMVICDAIACGACGNPSKGCEKVFGLTVTVGGSPGAAAEIIFTGDEGTTWSDTEVDTLGADEDPDDMACVGTRLVVISNDDDALHYATIANILAGTETWVRVATGIVAAGSPKAIFSLSARHTWIVGDGGYVYFSNDITTGVDVQTAGTVTAQNLLAIHGYDAKNLVAVGESNALIVTENGGDTWAAITGPNVGVNLSCVWMHTKDTWFVGCADGTLYYTIDRGTNWTQVTLSKQTNLSSIEDIQFSTPTVGWLSATTSTPAGTIYRTISGGNTWYVAPEGNTDLPANDKINSIAVCEADPNVIYAGGLADDASDGFIVKGA